MKKKLMLLLVLLFCFIPEFAFANVNYTGVPILMYHHFTDGSNVNSATVSSADFNRQMHYLYENGYTTIHLKQLEDFIDGKIQLPAKTVVITMDDGYRSNYEIAYPILRKYHMRATQFSITGSISGRTGYITNAVKIPHCSVDEMREMRDVFDFQSHTDNIHSLTTENKSLLLTKNADELYSDFTKANTTLALYGYTPYAFSYPYGAYNETIKTALKKTGIRMAVTVYPGRVTQISNKFELPRYNISGTINFEEFKKIVSEDLYHQMKPMVPTTPSLPSDMADPVPSEVTTTPSPEEHGEIDMNSQTN